MRGLEKTRELPLVLVATTGALLLGLSAQVKFYLWFTPVPITLQVFMVLLYGLMLNRRLALLSTLEYLALGLAGLPIFAGGQSGFEYLLGPTGGYLIGFMIAVFVIGSVRDSTKTNAQLKMQNLKLLFISLVGVGTIYACGFAWLFVWFHTLGGQTLGTSLRLAWQQGVMPFVGLDILKAIMAVGISKRLKA